MLPDRPDPRSFAEESEPLARDQRASAAVGPVPPDAASEPGRISEPGADAREPDPVGCALPTVGAAIGRDPVFEAGVDRPGTTGRAPRPAVSAFEAASVSAPRCFASVRASVAVCSSAGVSALPPESGVVSQAEGSEAGAGRIGVAAEVPGVAELRAPVADPKARRDRGVAESVAAAAGDSASAPVFPVTAPSVAVAAEDLVAMAFAWAAFASPGVDSAESGFAVEGAAIEGSAIEGASGAVSGSSDAGDIDATDFPADGEDPEDGMSAAAVPVGPTADRDAADDGSSGAVAVGPGVAELGVAELGVAGPGADVVAESVTAGAGAGRPEAVVTSGF